MSEAFVGINTFESFVQYVANLPPDADKIVTVVKLLDAKTKFPKLSDDILQWIVGLAMGCGLHVLSGVVVLVCIIHRRQLWFFKSNCGIFVANVRVVILFCITFVAVATMINGFNHAGAQGGLWTYRWTVLAMIHRYIYVWVALSIYVHGCFVQLYLSRRAAGQTHMGTAGGQWTVVALNMALLIVPIALPICATILALYSSLAFGHAIDAASELSGLLTGAAASSGDLSPTELAPARRIFENLARSQNLLRTGDLVWQVCVSLLSVAFVVPFLHHSRSLAPLVGWRVRSARGANTAAEATQTLFGTSPASTPPHANDPSQSSETEAGINIRSDSASLLLLVSGAYILGVLYIVLWAITRAMDFQSAPFWSMHYLLGNLLFILMGLGFDFLYLWPPLLRLLNEKANQRRLGTEDKGKEAERRSSSSLSTRHGLNRLSSPGDNVEIELDVLSTSPLTSTSTTSTSVGRPRSARG